MSVRTSKFKDTEVQNFLVMEDFQLCLHECNNQVPTVTEFISSLGGFEYLFIEEKKTQV